MALDFLKKIKDSSEEVIGELDGDMEKQPKAKKQKPKKEKKAKKQKPKKEKKPSLLAGLMKKEEKAQEEFDQQIETELRENQEVLDRFQAVAEEEGEDPSKYIKTDVAGGRTRQMLLNEFGLTDTEIIPNDLPSKEDVNKVRYMFSFSVPSGFDVDEVNSFIDLMMNAVAKYRGLVVRQHETINKLIDEILRVDRQALDQRNQEVLDTFITQGKDEREKLQNQLVDVQLAKSQLEQQIKQLQNGVVPKNIDVDALQSENEELRRTVRELEAKVSNVAYNEAGDESEVIRQELENALRTNEELANEVEEMKRTLSADDREAELLQEINELKRKYEALKEETSHSSYEDDTYSDEPIAPLSSFGGGGHENGERKVIVKSKEEMDKFKSLMAEMGDDTEDEEVLLAQIVNSTPNKAILSDTSNRTLTPELLQEIKESEAKADIPIVPENGTQNEHQAQTHAEEPDELDDMLNEFRI